MFNCKSGKVLLQILLLAGLGSIVATGCNGGDTDGGQGNDAAALGDGAVSNGGAGGSLEIELKSQTVDVGSIIDFFVEVRDASGNPVPFHRVFCESERGVAIIEPSSGGTAFEHTGQDGRMSGKLGGVTPGSFIVECRAQEGFNLVDRVTLKVTGEVPAGFTGFPGAAGGNLGGGVIVVQDPDEGVSVTTLTFSDVGGDSSSGPIDIVRNNDCDNNATTNDPEPFAFNNFKATLKNNTAETITVDTVQFTISDGRPAHTGEIHVNVQIPAGDSADVTGIFTEFVVASGNTVKSFAGSGDVVIAGTYRVTAEINGENESGDNFSTEASTSVTFAAVNNCGG